MSILYSDILHHIYSKLRVCYGALSASDAAAPYCGPAAVPNLTACQVTPEPDPVTCQLATTRHTAHSNECEIYMYGFPAYK